jgi:two-component system sensor histidine kinase YesM
MFIISSIFPLLLFVSIAASYAANSLREQAIENLLLTAETERQSVEYKLTEIYQDSMNLTAYFYTDFSRRDFNRLSDYNQLLEFESLRNTITNILLKNRLISNIRIYSDRFPFILSDNITYYTLDMFNELLLSNMEISETVPHDKLNAFITRNNSDMYITFYRHIRDTNGNIICVFMMDVDPGIFIDNGSDIFLDSDIFVYMLDENGALLYSNNKDDEIPELWDSTIKPEYLIIDKKIIVKKSFSVTDWSLVMSIPTENADSVSFTMFMMFLALAILAMLLGLILSFYLSKAMSKRINDFYWITSNLEKSDTLDLKAKSEQLDSLVKATRVGDELDKIVQTFSDFLKKNILLTNDMARRIIDIEKYKLIVLQEQIKPHFLYNTLDTLRACAISNQKETVLLLINSMSKFYRLSLSKGKDIITISEEIEMVDCYLNIEKIGYNSTILWQISYEEDLLDFPLPKFTLQPILENSIIHGKMSKNLNLFISVKTSENMVIIEIVDDGAGITKEKLSEIQSSINSYNTSSISPGFGLANIYNRLKLFYNQEVSFDVRSDGIGKGTATTIMLSIDSDSI